MRDKLILNPPMLLNRTLVTFAFCAAVLMSFGQAHGESPALKPALASGEFVIAKSIGTDQRDAVLGQIASSQSMLGESAAAIGTLREIQSPLVQQSAIGQTRDAMRGGGGAFADFDSLMQLIETTVAPDTWEALGGNSTMAPYPQGVFVDPSGVLREAVVVDTGETLENIDQLLTAGANQNLGNWRSPSPLRCVSLRRLRDEINHRRLTGKPLGEVVRNLAGLSSIQYLVFTDDDILIGAPVGGIDVHGGWFVDRESGRTALRSDFLARCFAAKLSGVAFGCTIDPTPQGMAAAAQVTSEIRQNKVAIGLAAERLEDALGMQNVEVFGTDGDTAIGLLMVEADRHMKQLALGEREMPDGVDNYLDVIDDFIDRGAPDGQLLRLWFTANPQAVRRDQASRVFEIGGTPIRLSGENQRALADGSRGAVTVDPRSQRFVEIFNQSWSQIRDKYPVYGALESLYRVAAVAELVDRHSTTKAHQRLAQSFAIEDETRDWNLVAPKQVRSIAKLHTVRKGKKRHHVLVASGGVAVQLTSTVSKKDSVYPTLSSTSEVAERSPIAVNRWWWDVR